MKTRVRSLMIPWLAGACLLVLPSLSVRGQGDGDGGGGAEPDAKEVGQNPGAESTEEAGKHRQRYVDTLSKEDRAKARAEEDARERADWKDLPVKHTGPWEKPTGETCPLGLTLRTRVIKITPAGPCNIPFSYGGLGTMGRLVAGSLAKGLAVGEWSTPREFQSILAGGDAKVSAPHAGGAKVGTKSVKGGTTAKPSGAPSKFATSRAMLFMRVSAVPFVDGKKCGDTRDCEMEFEVAYNGKVLKTFRESSADGSFFYVCVPFAWRRAKLAPDEDKLFVDYINGSRGHAQQRLDFLRSFAWANRPVPAKYCIVSQVPPTGNGAYPPFGGMTCDRQAMMNELLCMRELGINGLRGAGGPRAAEKQETGDDEEGQAPPNQDEPTEEEKRTPTGTILGMYSVKGVPELFAKGIQSEGPGFMTPAWPKKAQAAGKPEPEGHACLFHPMYQTKGDSVMSNRLAKLLHQTNVEEIWDLTVDELTGVYGGGKGVYDHMVTCRYCADAFHRRLETRGFRPSDFKAADWTRVRTIGKDEFTQATWRDNPAGALRLFYTLDLYNQGCANIFAAYRRAFDAANHAKRQAIARGDKANPACRQPWVYTFALRHSDYCECGELMPDFFDYYRTAENGYVWETTEYSWKDGPFTSFLCDAQRAMAEEMGTRTGIYIKPHRGRIVAVQRALSAVARGLTFIHWYTYGPDWGKGDNFCYNEALQYVSKAAHLIAAGEDVTYESEPATPPQVAWVCPRSSTWWGWFQRGGERTCFNASWEDARWSYIALQHAHVAFDTIDETRLETKDLSQYKVIYSLGPVLTRGASRQVEAWVKKGGVLCTAAHGLIYDESMQANAVITPMLGLEKRVPVETWRPIPVAWVMGPPRLDGLGALYADAPAQKDVAVQGTGLYSARFTPICGREVLKPLPATKVLARFGDGQAAATCATYGQGKVYVVGFWPGLEFSVPYRDKIMKGDDSFANGALPYVAGPAREAVKSLVDMEHADCVDATMVRNKKTGKLAIVLVNWTFKTMSVNLKQDKNGVDQLESHEDKLAYLTNLEMKIRAPLPVTKIRSAWLQQDLPAQRSGDVITVRLPSLEEADILLLE